MKLTEAFSVLLPARTPQSVSKTANATLPNAKDSESETEFETKAALQAAFGCEHLKSEIEQ